MGCRQSQNKGTESGVDLDNNSQMKVNGKVKEVSEFTTISSDCKTCEMLGITSKQIFSLKQSWKGIKRNMDDAGVEMFVR